MDVLMGELGELQEKQLTAAPHEVVRSGIKVRTHLIPVLLVFTLSIPYRCRMVPRNFPREQRV